MSRPMALALVLLVLFLTSQSEWRASMNSGSRTLPDSNFGYTPRQLRVEIHRDGVKEKIILDLMADVKHLEAENRRLRDEKYSLKQQLLQLKLAVTSAGCGGIDEELLSLGKVTARSTAAMSTDGRLVVSSTTQEFTSQRDASPESGMGFVAADSEIMGSAQPSERGKEREPLADSTSHVESTETPHPSVTWQNFQDHSDSASLAAWQVSNAHVATSFNSQESKSKEMQQLALDKLFRGRSGSLGTNRKIDTLPLMASRLNGRATKAFTDPLPKNQEPAKSTGSGAYGKPSQ